MHPNTGHVTHLHSHICNRGHTRSAGLLLGQGRTAGGAGEPIAPPLFCIVGIAPPSFAESENARFSVLTRACLADGEETDVVE